MSAPRATLRAGAALLLSALLLGLAAPERPVTVFVAGDSTAAPKRDDRRPETGWGEALQAFFDADRVRVVNLARNGRSTRSFVAEGRWEALLAEVRPGDVVLVQFGHNDQSESRPDRYTPPEAFRANLIRFVADVRARGGRPALLTPIVRRRFDAEGRFYDVHGAYPDLTRAVAAETSAPLLDLHRATEALVRAAGAEGSRRLFLHLAPGAHPNYPAGLTDDTHLSAEGARRVARLVAEAMRDAPLAPADALLPFTAPAPASAVVDVRHAGPDGAAVGGTPRFRTLGAALAAIPDARSGPYVVHLRDGRYHEKLTITAPDVHLVGESRDGTVLSFDAHGDTPGPDGVPLGTGGSATLTVRASGFRAARLTIANTFDYPANDALSESDPARVRNPQAVALMLADGSDRAVLDGVALIGYQYTFFADVGRAYVVRSLISGHVDFVFGAGQVVFDRAEIVSRDRPGRNPTGYVTAPSTAAAAPYGFLFVDCRFTREAGVPDGSVRLGRPWRPGNDPAVSGSAVFVRTFMDAHVGADGYAPISARDAAGERVWYDLAPESRFFEHESHGPGAYAGPRRPRLAPALASWYVPAAVLAGWDPAWVF